MKGKDTQEKKPFMEGLYMVYGDVVGMYTQRTLRGRMYVMKP